MIQNFIKFIQFTPHSLTLCRGHPNRMGFSLPRLPAEILGLPGRSGFLVRPALDRTRFSRAAIGRATFLAVLVFLSFRWSE
jgi:hypothetical protein